MHGFCRLLSAIKKALQLVEAEGRIFIAVSRDKQQVYIKREILRVPTTMEV